jgi:hypothetical protein
VTLRICHWQIVSYCHVGWNCTSFASWRLVWMNERNCSSKHGLWNHHLNDYTIRNIATTQVADTVHSVNNKIPYITRFGFTQFKLFYTKPGMFWRNVYLPRHMSLPHHQRLVYWHITLWVYTLLNSTLDDAVQVWVSAVFWNCKWIHCNFHCQQNEATWVEGKTSSPLAA